MEANKGMARGPERVIPILGCPDIRKQVEFYQALGFEVLGLYTAPNPYAALRWNSIELHFYGSRKIVPSENQAMCFLQVNDVDAVNHMFTQALKSHYGKIPRTGFPKITKVRSLVGDRRFTLTDTGGNTLFVGTASTEEDRFFRNLDNQQHAKIFAALYDVLYSKETPELAESMLPKYAAMGSSLEGLDRAKYLLLLADIQKQLNRKIEDTELNQLMAGMGDDSDEWSRIRQKHLEILQPEEE